MKIAGGVRGHFGAVVAARPSDTRASSPNPASAASCSERAIVGPSRSESPASDRSAARGMRGPRGNGSTSLGWMKSNYPPAIARLGR